MSLVRSAQAFQIVGGNGTVLWEGTGSFGHVIELVENGSTTEAINRSEAVKLDASNSILGPDWGAIGDGSTTTPNVPQHARIRGLRVAAAADVGFLGVSINTIPARVDADLVKTKYAGPIASVGSLMLVKCGSLTSSVIGNTVKGSATAGSVDAVLRSSFTTGGQQLGILVKLPGTTIASGQTGSAALCGVFVNPA